MCRVAFFKPKEILLWNCCCPTLGFIRPRGSFLCCIGLFLLHRRTGCRLFFFLFRTGSWFFLFRFFLGRLAFGFRSSLLLRGRFFCRLFRRFLRGAFGSRLFRIGQAVFVFCRLTQLRKHLVPFGGGVLAQLQQVVVVFQGGIVIFQSLRREPHGRTAPAPALR